MKQLLDEVFVMSRIIKVEVEVISLSRRLITLTETFFLGFFFKPADRPNIRKRVRR